MPLLYPPSLYPCNDILCIPFPTSPPPYIPLVLSSPPFILLTDPPFSSSSLHLLLPSFPPFRYRRLDLWLPHGLSATTSIASLASRITLCQIHASSCGRVSFTLSLPKPGLARLDIPNLQPRRQYLLTVKSSKTVLDGFGLPLKDSNQTFWSVDTDAYFSGPGLR